MSRPALSHLSASLQDAPENAHKPSHGAAGALSGEITPQAMMEPKPGRGIFVSPRVVDQVAFDELAAQLKSLIRDAQAQYKILGAHQHAITAKLDAATKAQTLLAQQIERATSLQSNIDGKLTKAAEVSALINRDLAAKLTELRAVAATDVHAIARSARAAAEQAVAEAISAALPAAIALGVQEALDTIATSSAGNQRELTSIVTKFEQRADAALTGLEERALTHRETLDGACERALLECAATERSIEGVSRLATEEITKTAQQVEHSITDANSVVSKMETIRTDITLLAQTVITSLEEDITQLSGRVQAARDASDEILQSAQDCLTAVSEHVNIIDAPTLREVANDTIDAVIKGTETALTLREATAVAGHHHTQQAQILEQLTTALTQATTLLPTLEQLVKRGDTVGAGLSKLLTKAS
jgi:hypothetical protein